MSDYYEFYKKKIHTRGATPYERIMKRKKREFDNYFKFALNKEPCLVDGVATEMVFQDHSQSNNKDLSDDKYVIAHNDVDIGVGSYVRWRNEDWMVFTEETKTIPTHQQLKMKEVNWTIKWLSNGKIVNDGKGYGAYVQNQTLYTLGVAMNGDLISTVDGKMMMYMQDNEDTRSIKISQRVVIGKHIYRIMFADIVSRKGVINFLMEQDTETEYDNIELGVANYWRDKEDEPVEENIPTDAKISGSETARIGSIETYEISDGESVVEWIVESIDREEQPFYALERDTKRITLQFKEDFRHVGSVVNILASLSDGNIVSLPVRVIKRF